MNSFTFTTLLTALSLVQIARPDGLDTWTWRNPLPTGNALSRIAYGNGQFVAVGDGDTILTSVNGVNWAQHPSGSADQLLGMAYGDNKYVALGWSRVRGRWDGAILTSADGTNWLQHPSLMGYILYHPVYGKGRFVALGESDSAPPALFVSADGVNWVVTLQVKPHFLAG